MAVVAAKTEVKAEAVEPKKPEVKAKKVKALELKK